MMVQLHPRNIFVSNSWSSEGLADLRSRLTLRLALRLTLLLALRLTLRLTLRLALRLAFAFVIPAAYSATTFFALSLDTGLWWSVHTWAGCIVLSGIAGLLACYVAVPPDESAA
jgi:hypothetical protein